MNEELSQEEGTTEQVVGNPTGKGGFGDNPQNRNPGGRPKNSMKSFVAKMLAEMSEEDKIQWLKANKITGIDMWKMGEGNPKQDMEVDATITGPGILRLDE